MTHINPDDPKWTAYIFGELSETERAAVELELETSEEARMLVEELRFAADLTKTELREAVIVTPLTTREREKIRDSASVVRPRRWLGVRTPIWAAGLTAASAAVIVLGIALSPGFEKRAMLLENTLEKAPPNATAQAVDPVNPTTTATDFGLRDERVEAQQTSAITDTSKDIQAAVKTETVAIPDIAFRNAAVEPIPAAIADRLAPLAPNAQAKEDLALPVVGTVAQNVEVAAGQDTLSQTSVGKGGAVGGGRLSAQAFASAPSPRVDLAESRTEPRAPGVPPEFDRARRGMFNGAESYDAISDNPFLTVAQNPLSTFSVDVDTASYSNVRRYLNQNQLPPRDAVRIEEMINYFAYDYPQPAGKDPIGASIEAASAPWNPQHRLVRVGIKARDIEAGRRPASNLVFLLDVSGSMQPPERLPMLKTGLRMLVEQLTANDRVTIVTYAGTTGVALQPTPGNQKDTIMRLIDSLQAGGSTNGASGIQLAYERAAASFIRNGVNRVILATDGDFNVGITNQNALLRLIEDKAKSGVFLSVLGVGMGNYKDATLEMLADKGNGNYAYIDTLNEARKVLVDQMNATMITVAKDVKVQVEFNQAVVDAYRLIGYENRALRNEDFNNDLKDAGDMGAGHTVTVLYEVVPRGVAINVTGVDPLKYQQQPAPPPVRNASNEMLTVKVRYQEPSGSDSKLLSFPLVDREQNFARSSVDLRFAAAVASFGMILRDSPYKGTATLDSVLGIAEDSLGSDRNGYRREFLQLVQRARPFRR